MRLFCDQCEARYNVSDSIVAGKLVRVRCRRCKASIIVDARVVSTSPAPPVEPPPAASAKPRSSSPKDSLSQEAPQSSSIVDKRAFEGLAKPAYLAGSSTRNFRDDAGNAAACSSRPKAAVSGQPRLPEPASHGGGWHVVLGRRQVGPLGLHEIEESIRSGRVTRKTYVWNESLDSWSPAGAVLDLENLFARHESKVSLLEKPSSRSAPPPRSSSAKRPAAAPEFGGHSPTEDASAVADIGSDHSSKGETGELPAANESKAGRRMPRIVSPMEPPEDLAPVFEDSSTMEEANRSPTGKPLRRDEAQERADEGISGADAFFSDDAGGAQKPDGSNKDPFSEALVQEAAASVGKDPFALATRSGDSDDVDGAPREETQFFIMASGVKKQKSPLRVGAFIAGMCALLAAFAFVVTRVGVVDFAGLVQGGERREAQPWASPARDTGLRDLLLGGKKEEKRPAGRDARHLVASDRTAGESLGESWVSEETELERQRQEELDATRASFGEERRDLLTELYGQGGRGVVSTRVRHDLRDHAAVDAAESPIDPEVIHRRVAEAHSAFDTCLQHELRRNPSFRGGRVNLVLTVAPSGVIRRARLEDDLLEQSDVGRCITRAARRMILPSFSGDAPIDIVVPLLLSTMR